ncbi:hypothetical protein AQUCO_02800023v1 [Aquilegia coerulea]|uniref:Uncharacterized protein n=1 Tax=Aquilegia coerulea TaxID=218851 RepID=A0A2G5D3N1_AQUCA|nr:hypothetical protein AQUCO_02800023v1 [Aquilegia coerulea]
MIFPDKSRFWKREMKYLLAFKPLGRRRSPPKQQHHMDLPNIYYLNQRSSRERKHENYEEEEEEEEDEEFDSPLSKEDWVITIREKLDQVPQNKGSSSWLNHSIFKVPRSLREIEYKAYTPQVVCIGPYHRGKPSFQDMENHKWRLLRHLLERTGHKLELYLEAMAELEEQTRRSYAKQSIEITSQEFIEMMLLDACFILELLRVSVKGFIYCGYSWGDPIFSSRGTLPCIQRDMLMLENQLPLFVLDRLFALSCEPDETDSVSQLALQFFDTMVPGCKTATINFDEPGLHFLHVIRQSLLPASKYTLGCITIAQNHKPQLMMHCVTMLRSAAVKFQKTNSNNFTDIEFKNGVLYIPRLVIHDSTKSIFLNLMAFEQCYPHCCNHVTSYISFMDGLINCPRDVAYLRHHKILDHGLGSEEEVASLFNNLCKEISFDINDCYLSKVSSDVNRYVDKKWNRWRASLKQEYFSNPWAVVSLVAAVFLIALTIAQTFYSVFAYYFPLS